MADKQEEPKTTPKEDGGLEVDLEGKPAENQEPKYVTQEDLEGIRKQLNGVSYMGRKLDELLNRQQPQPAPVDRDWETYLGS